MQTEFPILGVTLEALPMAAPKLKPRLYTVDEYLAMERAAEERHVYMDGEIFAMAGEADAHGIISVNIVISLGSQLKGNPCQVRTKETKVRSGLAPMGGHKTKGLFSYPDVLVICGEPEHHDAHRDIILNPKVIVEVLSESTEGFDRGDKFTRYQTCNPTLTDYVLVSQDKPQVEHFHKPASGPWTYQLYTGLDATVLLDSIGCTLKLADVYDRVVFPEE
jgi:Uma2 family endonuclease